MVDTIKFSEMTDGGDIANNNRTPGLLAGANVLFNNPWTFLNDGTTGDRPVPDPSMYYRLRFNTTLEVYEYYDPTTVTWTQLSGTGTGTVNPGVVNDIAFYAANGQAVSPIASNANSVLVSNGASVPSMSTTLPTGLSIPGATITASTAALTAGSVVAAPVAGSDITNKTYVDSLVGGAVTSITGTTNQVIASSPTGAVTLSLPQDIAPGSTPTFAGLTLTSIPLGSSSGGTGVDNAGSTLTLAGSLATIGAFSSNFTMTGATNVTFPTSGTLATVGATVSSITGTANQITASSPTGAVTLAIAANPVLPGTGGVTLPTGNTAQQAGIAGTIRFNSQTTVFEGTLDGVAWTPFSTAAGTVVSVSGTANRITSTGGTTPVIDISASYVGQSSITTVGALASGSLAAGFTPVTVPLGGTGLSSATAYAVLTGGTTSTGAFQSIASVGTSGQVLTSNGAGALPSFQTNAAFTQVVIQVFTADGTYTPTSGMKYCVVEAVGGGGGGGGCATTSAVQVAGAGGGGAGSYAMSVLSAATIAASKAVDIGAGGSGGSAGANNGSAGSDTTLGTTLVVAKGGSGGTGAAATGTAQANGGGAGGVAGTGTVTTTGGDGGSGIGVFQATAYNAVSGRGGNSVYGQGGRSVVRVALSGSNNNGDTPSSGNYGAGGGGAANTISCSATAGGNGLAGIMIITEYI